MAWIGRAFTFALLACVAVLPACTEAEPVETPENRPESAVADPAAEWDRRTKAKSYITHCGNGLKIYRLIHGRYPTTAEGLAILTASTDRHPEGILEAVEPNDPWGRPYEYTSDGRTYRIVSFGRDGVEGGEGFDADIRSDEIDRGE
jgi:type II secretion system protein G